MSQAMPNYAPGGPAVLQLPALEPPPGTALNFANAENRGAVLIIVNGILLAVMAIFMVISVYTKSVIIRKLSWDDLTVSFSALGAFALYGLLVWEVKRGPLGKHQWDVHVGEILSNNSLITSYLAEVTSTPTLWVTKFTFFLLYMQIFWPMRWMRISIYLGATLTTSFYMGATIALFVLSTPKPGQSWAASLQSERQQKSIELAIPISSVGLVIDTVLFILPSVAVYQLQLHTNRKLGLMLIFSTGLVAVISSAFSIYFRYVNTNSKDATWNLLNLQIMILVEIQVGVITANMPSFARMLHHCPPPWVQFQSRLSLLKRVFQPFNRKWSWSALTGGSNNGKPCSMLTAMPHESEGPFVYPEGVATEGVFANSASRFELDDLKSMRTIIKSGWRESVDEDDILLKQELEHTLSSMDPNNAGTGGERQ